MNTTPSSSLHFTSTTASDGERALVLGGAGSAGNAWLIGVIAGLCDAGMDVTEADLIIGTSAGSTAAAQITSATPTDLLAAILGAVHRSHGLGPARSDGGSCSLSGRRRTIWRRRGAIIGAAEDAADMRRRMGAAALEMDAAAHGSAQAQWRVTVAARLAQPGLAAATVAHTWRSMPTPANRSCSTAAAESAWRTPSPPALAPTASASLPTAIGARRYINGGYRAQRERRSGGRIWAGAGAVTTRRPITAPVGVGHPPRGAGRRTTRTWQRSRNGLPG
jgi:NTE family protein